MARMTAIQKAGLALIVLSPVGGLVGTAWSIYSSFGALEAVENAGIGPVGDQIENAMLFTVGGLVGSVTGVLLVILGQSKADRV